MNVLKANVIYFPYTDKIYITWNKLNDITSYKVYKDSVLIAETPKEITEDTPDPFVEPTMFDRNHNTNLFKDNPQNSLMYVDETVVKHKTYSYMIVAERSNGSIEQSRTVFINIP